MGKLDEALADGSGFPSVMPGLPWELTVPQKMALSARILDREGYSDNIAGHITAVRDDADDGRMWSTPYGLWWHEVSAGDIITVDTGGRVLEGRWDITPAVFIHTELHRARPDAKVIVHNHPPYGTLLATLKVAPDITDQQACMFDGDIVLWDEYTGGISDSSSGQQMADAVGSATAVILANHGVLILGETVEEATFRASTFERTCRLNYQAMASGQKPVPVPVEHRATMKRAMNAPHMAVRYYWDGAVRRVLATEPDVVA